MCVVGKVFLAIGTQNYRSNGKAFVGIGPFAELFTQDPEDGFDIVEVLNDGDDVDDDTPIEFDKLHLKGMHYKGTEDNGGFRAAPAWEFDFGRVIAQSAVHLASPEGYIDWLNVAVADGNLLTETHEYNRVYRVLTIGGVAPRYKGQKDATVGSPYTTIYVVLTCEENNR